MKHIKILTAISIVLIINIFTITSCIEDPYDGAGVPNRFIGKWGNNDMVELELTSRSIRIRNPDGSIPRNSSPAQFVNGNIEISSGGEWQILYESCTVTGDTLTLFNKYGVKFTYEKISTNGDIPDLYVGKWGNNDTVIFELTKTSITINNVWNTARVRGGNISRWLENEWRWETLYESCFLSNNNNTLNLRDSHYGTYFSYQRIITPDPVPDPTPTPNPNPDPNPDPNPNPDPEPEPEPEPEPFNIIGTWRGEDDGYEYIVVFSNNSVTITEKMLSNPDWIDTDTGTYEINGNTVTLHLTGWDTYATIIDENTLYYDEFTMYLTRNAGGKTILIKLERVM